ncbi:hypothetical protein BO82DRAFT_176166 [Aspergillus uvarum CBS 121591]|uniref:Uncharacterized protein n=1 Tax=Aspergillus uvarum CBS 121591 TaxID=1448315 RepID=A0A319BVH6_9EURO|nr:hypothetical protein BO82DRAFT_176166 [Aspergillus uvarum CBS 121591]PYH77706.1 hypothetical protein BO82DRAFT_176166 [Aspergillus uvarum CBS 121591]
MAGRPVRWILHRPIFHPMTFHGSAPRLAAVKDAGERGTGCGSGTQTRQIPSKRPIKDPQRMKIAKMKQFVPREVSDSCSFWFIFAFLFFFYLLLFFDWVRFLGVSPDGRKEEGRKSAKKPSPALIVGFPLCLTRVYILHPFPRFFSLFFVGSFQYTDHSSVPSHSFVI